MAVEEQLMIESGGGRLYGMLHRPDREPAGSIVFCNPLFEERKSAHRVMVEAARVLCADGLAVLRFDYRGCGDSSGEFRDFSVPAWLDDIKAASAFLKGRYPKCPAGFLGLRLGASLALTALSHAASMDFAVLWEPVVNGRDHVEQEFRKKLMQEMVTFGRGRETRRSLLETLEQGREIDFDGYALSPALYRDLCRIDLLSLDTGNLPARLLVVNISSSEHPAKQLVGLQEKLSAAGCPCKLIAVREPPFWNLVGLVECPSLISETQRWKSL